MRGLLDPSLEYDPPTDAMAAIEGMTTAGAPSTLHLHHLHGLLTALTPLHAAYTSAAIDRLRALPLEARRAILPHLLHEHPDLVREPRVRALADEVMLDTEAACDRPDLVRWLARVSGVRASSPDDVLARVEQALVLLASGLADALRACRDPRIDVGDALPDDATALLTRLLERPAPVEHDGDLADASAEIALHASALRAAARDAALALAESLELGVLEARANVPRWWPTPFREAALWTRARAEQRASRRARADVFDELFTRAYLAHVQARRA